MESALLHSEVIEVERERSEMLRQGLTPEAARDRLENKYRIYSREKGAFTCSCCSSRVVMVLYADRAIFRHYDSEACAGERNYIHYAAGREKARELADKHAEGKELLRRTLQLLQDEGDTFEDGYLYKKELRYVPDFLLTARNGERWAIDYIVSLKGDAAYRRKLRNRLACYRSHDFKPLFLIDRSWLAVTESAYISFNHSELDMRTPVNPYDERWKRELALPPLTMQEPVYSLVYLDVPQEQAVLARFQMSGDRWGRLLFEPEALPLDHLLAVDGQWLDMNGQAMLQLFKVREQKTIQDYCQRLRRILLEEEQDRAEEEARRIALEERVKALREAGRAHTHTMMTQAGEPGQAAAASAPAAPVNEGMARLIDLLRRCKQSPRRADYPGLEDNLARAEALIEQAGNGELDAPQCYKSAWSILRNVSYPLLGE
ncbi:hypothetical protein [Paenibacillus spongiae]|uniref:Competence protein CoiA n=1 Tax=Paenibacillus spongiae TaxID=2909671 RepID=A0ABY5SFB2_9BACL|nr:hypothetical protein [Paenibacillus spongiae]UVI32679.1 hypothetical protein L1F29_13005 [Paenibacillus spongiae]